MVISVIGGVAVAVVLAVLLFSVFFDGRDDFLECLRYYFTPDIVSMFRGEYGEDWWGTTKLGLWLLFSVGPGAATFYLLFKHFGGG